MKTIITCILAGTLVFLGSCVSESSVDPLQELTNSQQQKQIQKSELTLSDEEFYALVQSIPSPLQVSALMEALGLPYDETYTVKTDNVDGYGNWFAQATNMGIYGADMGYANVYGEMKKSLDYLGAIRKLADELKVGQFFDIATIKEMAENSDDIDALTNASQINFQKMNDYLQKQNRGKVSVAMILGGWVEGLYLSTIASKNDPDNEILREQVAEQKLSIESISMLLSLYSSDEYFKSFLTTFSKLTVAFENIKMIYHEGEIKQYEDANGNLVVEDSSSTEIIVTNSDVDNIYKVVLDLRKQLVNAK